MSAHTQQDPTVKWTSSENRGLCGFCGKEEGGYAKQDATGVWLPACWSCVAPAENIPVVKRPLIKSAPVEDLDTEAQLKAAAREAKKAPGLAPSTVRASTF